jgi:hypothetical protein
LRGTAERKRDEGSEHDAEDRADGGGGKVVLRPCTSLLHSRHTGHLDGAAVRAGTSAHQSLGDDH